MRWNKRNIWLEKEDMVQRNENQIKVIESLEVWLFFFHKDVTESTGLEENVLRRGSALLANLLNMNHNVQKLPWDKIENRESIPNS